MAWMSNSIHVEQWNIHLIHALILTTTFEARRWVSRGGGGGGGGGARRWVSECVCVYANAKFGDFLSS